MKIGNLTIVVLIAWAAAGCERWMRVVELPAPDTMTLAPVPVSTQKSPVLVLTSLITQNGAPQNPNAELERRLVGLLHESGLFSHTAQVGYAEVPESGHVQARLSIEEHIDPHTGQTAWRGFLIGASMFTLTTFFPMEYDYAARMTLELRRWDGHVRRYAAASEGTAFFHVFGASPLTALEVERESDRGLSGGVAKPTHERCRILCRQ